tara:strand:- start:1702 stop:2049 length:348 start_codon:yes stop_codon:yes gene_type:complete
MFIVVKYLITAFIVVMVSEAAKRSDHLGALLAALPITTLLVLVWLHVEGAEIEKISNHAFYTFWYVVPTLPMFLLFPLIYPKLGFWLSLLSVCAITIVLFLLWSKLMSIFGVEIL